jgi:hypothetical protein
VKHYWSHDFEPIFEKEFRMTHASTALITLVAGPFFVFGQLVQELTGAELAISKLLDEQSISMKSKDSAVVISRTTTKGRVAGKEIDAQFRATSFW